MVDGDGSSDDGVRGAAGTAHDADPVHAADAAADAAGAAVGAAGAASAAADAAGAAAGAAGVAADRVGLAVRRDLLSGERRAMAAPFVTGLLAGLGLLVAYVLYLSISTVLTTLIVLAISILLAVGLDPPVRLLTRHRVPRKYAVTIAYFGLLAFIVGALYAIIPPIVEQVAAFAVALPAWLKDISSNPTIRSLDDQFDIIKRAQSLANKLGPDAASGVFTAAGVALDLVIVLILTLYFLSGLPRMTRAAYRLAPESRRLRVAQIGDKIIKQLGGYLGGATLIALQAGLVAGVFAAIVGLPYPWAIAAGAAILDFVPVVGPVVVGVSMVLLGFSQSLTVGIVAGIFYVCQHLFEAYWLYPKVMRRTVHISSVAVIVAILVGAALLGVVGAILAVPFAAAVQIVMHEVFLPRQDAA